MLRGLALLGFGLAAGGLVACNVGSVLAAPDGGGGDDGDDGSVGPGSSCPAADPTTAGAGGHAANGVAATDTAAPSLTPHEGCMSQSACHNANMAPGSTPWDFGGEAFQDVAGTIPYAGATILLFDGTQYEQIPVLANGFFYAFDDEFDNNFPTPSQTPLNAWLCDGSNMMEMTTQLATVSTDNTAAMTDDGNCNGGTACHGSGAAGAFIYLTPAT